MSGVTTSARVSIGAPERVSSLELFFDLVFVFTITQVATVVVHSPGSTGLGHAAVELAVIYWMYGGYAWLTNTTPPDTGPRRAVLLAGMAAFFVAALCVPDAFGSAAIWFGVSYVAVNLVHSVGFLVFTGRGAVRTVARLGAFNLASSGVLLAAGLVHGAPRWWLWVAAVLLQWLTSSFFTGAHWDFEINAAHFGERHGLVILIVLGESLVSIGVAGDREHVGAALVAGVLAGLLAVAALWWAYFGGDDERAATALQGLPATKRPAAALLGYFAAHLIMLSGVLAVAAGARLAAGNLSGRPAGTAAAWLIAGGAAGYLVGTAAFRRALRSGRAVPRVLGGALCLLAFPVGAYVSSAWELAAVAALVLAAVSGERARRTGSRANHSGA
jgi:low temperature requirement protein LtrA